MRDYFLTIVALLAAVAIFTFTCVGVIITLDSHNNRLTGDHDRADAICWALDIGAFAPCTYTASVDGRHYQVIVKPDGAQDIYPIDSNGAPK